MASPALVAEAAREAALEAEEAADIVVRPASPTTWKKSSAASLTKPPRKSAERIAEEAHLGETSRRSTPCPMPISPSPSISGRSSTPMAPRAISTRPAASWPIRRHS